MTSGIESLLNAPYGVILVDESVGVRWSNRAVAAMLDGVEPSARQPLLFAFRGAGGTSLETLARETLRTGTTLKNRRVALPLPDGKWRWLNTTLHSVSDEHGKLTGVCCLLADVTQESMLVEALWQTQKLETAGYLANVFAHDFNNLLAVIQGYCDLLLMKASDDEFRDRLGKIRSAAVAAAGLSRQLLLFTRPGTTDLAALDLNLALRAMKIAIERTLPPNIARVFELEEQSGAVLANAGQVEQIVATLVTNAIDAMPDGGTLTVRTATRTVEAAEATALALRPGHYICIAVIDSGMGIGDGEQRRLFEAGYTTKADRGGAGMGLLTVRTIVERLHGTVTVESSRGKGSTFTVWFPRAPSESDTADTTDALVEAGGRRILLVEADRAVQESFAAGLTAVGFRVVSADSADEALRIVRKDRAPIDLLLCSDVLADRSGAALADAISEERPGVAVLLTSTRAQGRAPGVAKATAESAVPYRTLAKPCTLQQLVQTISLCLHPLLPD